MSLVFSIKYVYLRTEPIHTCRLFVCLFVFFYRRDKELKPHMRVVPPKHVLRNSSKVSFAHVPEIQTTSEFGHRARSLPPPKSVLATSTRLDARPCRRRHVNSKTGFRTPARPKCLMCAGAGRPTPVRLGIWRSKAMKMGSDIESLL